MGPPEILQSLKCWVHSVDCLSKLFDTIRGLVYKLFGVKENSPSDSLSLNFGHSRSGTSLSGAACALKVGDGSQKRGEEEIHACGRKFIDIRQGKSHPHSRELQNIKVHLVCMYSNDSVGDAIMRIGSISNIDDTEYKCLDGTVPDVRNKVISGVVGASSSGTSIQVANLLRLFKIPQVIHPFSPYIRCVYY